MNKSIINTRVWRFYNFLGLVRSSGWVVEPRDWVSSHSSSMELNEVTHCRLTTFSVTDWRVFIMALGVGDSICISIFEVVCLPVFLLLLPVLPFLTSSSQLLQCIVVWEMWCLRFSIDGLPLDPTRILLLVASYSVCRGAAESITIYDTNFDSKPRQFIYRNH